MHLWNLEIQQVINIDVYFVHSSLCVFQFNSWSMNSCSDSDEKSWQTDGWWTKWTLSGTWFRRWSKGRLCLYSAQGQETTTLSMSYRPQLGLSSLGRQKRSYALQASLEFSPTNIKTRTGHTLSYVRFSHGNLWWHGLSTDSWDFYEHRLYSTYSSFYV